MGWKKLIFGEKLPDKNDPKYKERYEKEVEAGRKTCRFLRLDKAAAAIQRFANRRPKLFLGLIFSVVIWGFKSTVDTPLLVFFSTSIAGRLQNSLNLSILHFIEI